MNIKRGGVCIYYKISLPLKMKIIQYLQECINFEIKIKDKICNFITLYRSPNQCQDDFESFINNFELNLDSIMTNHPFLTVTLGDFNAKSSLWYNNDITTYEGSKIDGVTSQFGLQQIIKEPTNIIGDSSSCTDLIFTTQPNLVMESGVHSNEFPWDNCFANISVNEQVQLFTQTIQNIISNYIPHETITCDDRNPPWIDEKIKKLVLHKNRAYNAYSRDKNNTIFLINFHLFKHIKKLQLTNPSKSIIHAYLINY